MPAAEKRRFAHILLDASGTLEETDAHARALTVYLARLAEEIPLRPAVRDTAMEAALREGPRRGPRGLAPERWLADADGAREDEMIHPARLLDPARNQTRDQAAPPGPHDERG